jgi:hypothetical protein
MEIMMPTVAHVDETIEGGVYVGRAMPRRGLKASPFANPFRLPRNASAEERTACIGRYVTYLTNERRDLLTRLPELRSAPALLCWCRHDGEEKTPYNACHGDVIAWILERFTDDELRAMATA